MLLQDFYGDSNSRSTLVRLFIDVGTGGALGEYVPQDFAINKEVLFLFSENDPFF